MSLSNFHIENISLIVPHIFIGANIISMGTIIIMKRFMNRGLLNRYM